MSRLETLERWTERWDTFDRRMVFAMAGFSILVGVANCATGNWSAGSAWLVTAIWAGNCYWAKRAERRAEDAMRMLRELAQLPYGNHIIVDVGGGEYVIGKYVKHA